VAVHVLHQEVENLALPLGEHWASFCEHVFDQSSGGRGRRQTARISQRRLPPGDRSVSSMPIFSSTRIEGALSGTEPATTRLTSGRSRAHSTSARAASAA